MDDDEGQPTSNGVITFEEYERAVLRFRERMAANGTPLGDFRFDEQTQLYDWTVREEYFSDPGAQACDTEFKPIDMAWQARVEPLLEPARERRRVQIIECMRANGADVDLDLPYRALMVWAVPEFPECVEAAFQE